MAKARTPRMQAIVVLIAGLAVADRLGRNRARRRIGWRVKPPPPPRSGGDTGKRQDGKRVTDKDCPFDDATHDDSSIDL